MIVLSGTNVKEMLSMEVCIDLMADVMVKVSSGQCVLPLQLGDDVSRWSHGNDAGLPQATGMRWNKDCKYYDP